MFGFIKNLFGGIFGFLARLLGIKKSEYFLELDKAPENGSAKAESASAKKPEPVAAQSLVAVAAPAKSEKREPVAAKPQKAEPAPKPAVAVTNGKVPAQAASTITFAPDYLMPTPTTNRRLPGPNMNNFRDMARGMKTSK
ncbi:hypothetical protein [Kamptonema sp. UHCC 0994]|uniref:hypothetical protein n=1 Tax=Kamptonema sp. UHCC 0994 TaxID=3031329 RepID=UPI0023B9FC6D|nr:hypothetical protein [Kamptonema sp. UHCC 0994]MDF0555806.1 hypothetical protein [Kamptonema sp. UHCC 0994]